MHIESTLKIQGSIDYCQLQRKPDGGVSIGAITLLAEEVADFPQLLAEALKLLPSKTVDGKSI